MLLPAAWPGFAGQNGAAVWRDLAPVASAVSMRWDVFAGMVLYIAITRSAVYLQRWRHGVQHFSTAISGMRLPAHIVRFLVRAHASALHPQLLVSASRGCFRARVAWTSIMRTDAAGGWRLARGWCRASPRRPVVYG